VYFPQASPLHGVRISEHDWHKRHNHLPMKVMISAALPSWLLGIATIPNPQAGDGTILRNFVPPITQYGPGHRGVDLAAFPDDVVTSPVNGQVHFVGYVVNRAVITIATATALISFEPVESFLLSGDQVSRGQIIGWVSYGGHCDQHCIHVGVRNRETRIYLDPIPYLLQLPRLIPVKP